MSSTTSGGYGGLAASEPLDATVRRLLAEHGGDWRALPLRTLKSKIHRLLRRGDTELSRDRVLTLRDGRLTELAQVASGGQA